MLKENTIVIVVLLGVAALYALLGYLILVIAPRMPQVVWVILGVIIFLGVAWFGAAAALDGYRGRTRWRRWFRRRLASLEGDEFLADLRQFVTVSHGAYAWRFLQVVRERGLLIASDDTERLLIQLALTAEQGLTAGKATATEENGVATHDAFVRWLEGIGEIKLHWARLGPQFVDELSLLIEQIRQRKLGDATAGASVDATAVASLDAPAVAGPTTPVDGVMGSVAR